MSSRAGRSSIPEPLRRTVISLAGWGFWVRRELRRRRRRPQGGGLAPVAAQPAASGANAASAVTQGAGGPAGGGGARGLDAVLPPGAPDSILARNKHGVYCVPRAARARLAARVTLEGEVWESDTVDLVAGVDPTGDIVHAGTFFGDFLPAFAASRADGAIVWAFEPGEQNRRCTEITISLNGLENVKLTPAGLSASEGSALLAVGDRDGTPLGGASRLISDPSRLRWWDSERVRLVAVDDVVPADRRVAAIQLDVEGHEQEALQGALATIVRWRPLIVLETMPAPAWVAEHLTPLGYTPQQPVDRNVVLRCA